MKSMKFLLAYLDESGEEQIEELFAYSEQQAHFLALDYCSEDKILSLECTVRRAAY